MSEADIEGLAEDIKKHGQREPGLLLEGQVLDGWHRYLACQKIGTDFWSEDFTGDNPVAFVLSKNLHRRHLTASQRAAALSQRTTGGQVGGVQLCTPLPRRPKWREEAEVSERTIVDAKRAQEIGLGEEVRTGKVSAHKAAAVAKLPKAKREKAVKRSRTARSRQQRRKRSPTTPSCAPPHRRAGQVRRSRRESLAEMTDLAASAKAFEEKTEFKEMQVLRVELRSCKRGATS
jgi:hypothetical protein